MEEKFDMQEAVVAEPKPTPVSTTVRPRQVVTPSQRKVWAAPQAFSQTAAQKAAADKKTKFDAALAKLQASTFASATAEIAAAETEAARIKAEAQDEEDLRLL